MMTVMMTVSTGNLEQIHATTYQRKSVVAVWQSLLCIWEPRCWL